MAGKDDRAAWALVTEQMQEAGGVVQNVRLGKGTRGRGLFVEDRGAPAVIALPPHMLIAVDDVALRDGCLVVKPDADVPPDARTLFDTYYATFGFSRDIQREARRAIAGQHQLPGPLQDMILKGNRKGLTRFPAFEDAAVLEWLFNTRSIEVDGTRKLMPMVELANHDAGVAGFDTRDIGVRIAGTFQDEMLVRYHVGDPWTIYLRWGFAAPSDRLYALGLEVTEPAGWQIIVRPETLGGEIGQDTQITVQGRSLTIDRMLLTGPSGAEAARALFRTQVADFGLANPDELFSLITKINKDWFNRVLTLSKGSAANPGLKGVRAAAKLQLKMLERVSSD